MGKRAEKTPTPQTQQEMLALQAAEDYQKALDEAEGETSDEEELQPEDQATQQHPSPQEPGGTE